MTTGRKIYSIALAVYYTAAVGIVLAGLVYQKGHENGIAEHKRRLEKAVAGALDDVEEILNNLEGTSPSNVTALHPAVKT